MIRIIHIEKENFIDYENMSSRMSELSLDQPTQKEMYE